MEETYEQVQANQKHWKMPSLPATQHNSGSSVVSVWFA
jgi:hypothetical protein